MNLDHFVNYLLIMIIVTVITTVVPNVVLQLTLIVVAFGGFLAISWPAEE